ncbi:MAG: hypothetical protein C0582_04545, partial [Alphaproteobacteria bacterium]
KTLTLSLPQLKKIEKGFLYKNQSLKTLTLSLPQVTQIGKGFLAQCQSLKTLTLSLPQLKKIGNDFLYNCRSLETLNLDLPQPQPQPQPQLKKVIGPFLPACLQLKSVDLRSLLNLKEVLDIACFMAYTYKLEEVSIDARQKEFFEELLKDKPDLLSKFVVA